MQHLIRIFAPRTPAGWVVKTATLLVLIAGFKVALIGLLGLEGNVATDILVAVGVALPFVLLALSLIGYLDDLQRRLAHLASTDMLTGLPNRRAFFDSASESADQTGTLLMIDVDHFKRINDLYGHDAGDRCLQAVAEHLAAHVRQNDLVARVGGEEFAAFLRDADRDTATRIGERLAAGLAVPLDSDGQRQIQVTLSLGAVITTGGSDLDVMLAAADRALYSAKDSGRARILFAPETSAAASAV